MGGVYSALNVPVTSFVNNSQTMAVASLLSTYPAGPSYLGFYARVSDLWSSVEEVMRCSYDGSTYYWRPQRTDYAINSSQTSGTMTLTPLVSAPEITLQATLLGNMTITPVATNAWPGCQFKIRSPASLGIFSITFTGLIGGITSTLLGGADKIVVYTASGWRS